MGLAVVLVVMGAVGVHIHISDVRERLVPAGDLAVLCVMRAALCAGACSLQCCGKSSWAGIYAEVWGVSALLQQGLRGAILVALVMAINAALSRKQPDGAIGAGDVKLYFICCLYLSAPATALFLAASTSIGVLQALYCCIKKQRTFAFAPALVWSCFAALCF